jgi:hypothetical protein
MPLLPKPYPDEVVGSLIMRGCRHAGVPLKRMLQHVYGGPRSYTSLLMTTQPRRVALLAGVDAEELLRQHTVLPYATAFFPKRDQLAVREKALGLGADESVSSLTKTLSAAVPFRRICQACVRHDVERFGESYWHRVHLLPGVETCVQHGSRLLRTHLAVKGHAQSSSILMPEELHGVALRTRLPQVVLEMLTAVSNDALSESFRPSNNVLGYYREQALAFGYQLNAADIAGRALALALRKMFGAALLKDMAADWKATDPSPWPARMVRPSAQRQIASPKHVLMLVFLANSMPGTFERDATYRAPGQRGRNYTELDAKAARSVVAAVKRAAAQNERCGVRQVLEAAGVWAAYRHNRSRFPVTGAEIEALKYSDQALRQVGRREHWRARLGMEPRRI